MFNIGETPQEVKKRDQIDIQKLKGRLETASNVSFTIGGNTIGNTKERTLDYVVTDNQLIIKLNFKGQHEPEVVAITFKK